MGEEKMTMYMQGWSIRIIMAYKTQDVNDA